MPAEGYRVGRGISDITGEPAGVGMLGYGKAGQRTAGIHTRLRSRAFVVARDDSRVLLVVNDLPLVFDSIHREVLRRLAERYGDQYTERNVMITATHTHCGPGGYSHHLLYNTTTNGFRRKTFAAIVEGIVEAVERAHDDLAPAELSLVHGELRNASVNRSRAAFDRNPASERAYFPDAIDPQTTLLRIRREGRLVGAVNWFATHNTSMTNRNRLISADNKGYAGYHWERVVHGVDYRTDYRSAGTGPAGTGPAFVGAFAQTNAGDMSPNLGLKPGSGPTGDEFENTRIIGLRQYEKAAEMAEVTTEPLDGPVDARLVYVDLDEVTVGAEFTGDGRSHRTSGACAGASSLAGAWVDGPGFPGFRPGHRNPVFAQVSRLVYRLSSRLRDSQAPKALVFPGGLLDRVRPLVASRAPVQLLRIGRLYLIGVPGEVTIVAGLRLRRVVAPIVRADPADVLVAGYSNGYIHYVTTPEEYDAQQYQGGSTLFGRWELGALCQSAAALATAMRDGDPVDPGPPPPDLSGRQKPGGRAPRADAAPRGHRPGDVLVQPLERYRPGERLTVSFVGADPNHDLHRGDTYLEVQRRDDQVWRTVADDGDWSTRFHWRRARPGSRVTLTWHIPPGVAAGHYRLRYLGDALTGGRLAPFAGTTRPLQVDDQTRPTPPVRPTG
ncbi:MAG TPA: neutral/alkaline non-lysosomal ceramidase N-terminal domain-containing protein [Pseudonocardia sp.]|nr:neutral/alkaline non-lysosomal ceramidase N-terminal domain-containing protein [Pseudonocardia sp.]